MKRFLISLPAAHLPDKQNIVEAKQEEINEQAHYHLHENGRNQGETYLTVFPLACYILNP